MDEDEERERKRFAEAARKVLQEQSELHEGISKSEEDIPIIHIPRPKLSKVVDDAIEVDLAKEKLNRRSSSIEPINPSRSSWTHSQVSFASSDRDEDLSRSSEDVNTSRASRAASENSLAAKPKRQVSQDVMIPPPTYEASLGYDPVPDTNMDDEKQVEAAMKLSSVGFRTEAIEREGTQAIMDLDNFNADADIPDAPAYRKPKKKKKKKAKEADPEKDSVKPKSRSLRGRKRELEVENPEIFRLSHEELPPLRKTMSMPVESKAGASPAAELAPLSLKKTAGIEDSSEEKKNQKSLLDPIPPIKRTDRSQDVERAEEKEEFTCTSAGRLNPVFTSAGRFYKRQKQPRCLVISAIIIAVILGLMIFVSVFPPSFVYLNYDKIALSYNTITGAVDRSQTYYGGCYILGPSTRFKEFTATAHTVSVTADCFTADSLPIVLTYSFQFFIKGSELGELHRKFGQNYESVIKSVAKSEIKNLATPFTVNEYRLERLKMEKYFHEKLKQRLAGDCCDSCCPSQCTNNTVCSSCNTSPSCDKAYHIKLPYFQLAAIDIPQIVTDKYLQRALLQVKSETEYFKQSYKVEVKLTEREVQKLKNQAEETIDAGVAISNKIRVESEALREANLTNAYVQALSGMYSELNIVQEDHKLSVFMIRALEDQSVKGNLYRGYNYNKTSLWTNPDGNS